MFGKAFNSALCVCVALAAVSAVQARESLDLPDGQEWKHSHSGITVPATLAGLERSDAIAFRPDELDTAITFDTDDRALSVYVYRFTSGGAPVWFAQARAAIEQRDVFSAAPESTPTETFSLPGRDDATGLRVVYALPQESSFKSTGLAVFASGEWLVKVRASSRELGAGELEDWMMQAIAELGLPNDLDPGAPATPVSECETRLKFDKEAKDAPKDGAAALLSGILGQVVREKLAEQASDSRLREAVQWCRDSTLGDNQTLYRPNQSTERYLIALGDSAVGLSVGPDAGAQLLAGDDDEAGSRYVATMHYADRDVSFVAQDRLPPPQRVVALVNGKRIATTVSTWGEGSSIEINADAMETEND